MKRQGDSIDGQPIVKRPGTGVDTFRSKIAAKLHTLLDDVLSETRIGLESSNSVKLPDIEDPVDSPAFQNFINSAKSCIAKLLAESTREADNVNSYGKELPNFESYDATSSLNDVNCAELPSEEQDSSRINCKVSDKEKENTLPGRSSISHVKSRTLDPLQTQISHKFRSLLCRAFEQKKLDRIKAESEKDKSNISDGEWQNLSSTLQNVLNSSKFANLLSENSSENQSKDSTLNSQNQTVSHPTQTVSQTNNPTLLAKEMENFELSENSVHVARDYVPYYCHMHPHVGRPFENFEVENSLPSSLIMEPEMSCMSYNSSPPNFLTEDNESPINESYESSSGILLLEHAVPAPDVLDLGVKSDLDDDSEESSSEPDVVVLGEKRPTYEVITLEEDEDETSEASSEKKTEILYECSQCGKSFRVESLLKFHIRMHGENSMWPKVALTDISLPNIASDHTRTSDENQLVTEFNQRSSQEKKDENPDDDTVDNEDDKDAGKKKIKLYKKKHRGSKHRKHKASK